MEDKLQVILELQEQGKNRTEIWKALGYTNCSGLTRYMDSKGYKYNEHTPAADHHCETYWQL